MTTHLSRVNPDTRHSLPSYCSWVRCVAVDPSNEWFATGSADRTIKIWDLASGQLKLTLTGHIEQVRAAGLGSGSAWRMCGTVSGHVALVRCLLLCFRGSAPSSAHYHCIAGQRVPLGGGCR